MIFPEMQSVSVFLAGVYESFREAAEQHVLIVDEFNSTRSCNGMCPGATREDLLVFWL
jgi:hypothetical protein